MRATRIGMLVLLVAAAGVATVLMLGHPAGVRYVGEARGTSALVSLRVPAGKPAPAQVVVDVGDGVRIVAARLR